MTALTSPRLDALRDPVDRSAALIEQAFVAAGEGLGAGLAGFDSLTAAMTDFLAGLQGGTMTEASQGLTALANRLVATGQALPRDAASLRDLVAGNASVAKHLETLLDDIRMMAIIARSARIEAVVFGEGTGLDAFTSDIATLTRTVQEEVGRCARAHALLTGRIGAIAAAQADLDRNYRNKLVTLSEDLAGMFDAIAARQGESTDVMRQLGERGARITVAAGTALMALQSGDATRQRLEHVSRAIGIARDVAAGTRGLDDAERDPVVSAILPLQAAQLRALSGDFDRDVAQVDGLLKQLGCDALDLIEGGGALLQAGGSAQHSFLAAFRVRLTEAAALVGTCERARREVEAAMVVFRDEVTVLSGSVAGLEAVTINLVMIGINSGLKAARLGPNGRSLTVIADELKRLASVISTEATRLVVAFAAVESTSHRLDEVGGDAGLAASDKDLLAIAVALETHDAAMAGFFATMRDRALSFDMDLARARERFRVAVSSGGDLARVAHELEALAPIDATDQSRDAVAAHLATWLWPLYTMACERDLHVALVGSQPQPSGLASGSQAGSTLDDILFDMAG